MNNLVNKSLIGMGLAGYDLTTGLLSPSTSGHTNPFVWILSSTSPQPAGIYGIWYDNATWDDTALWYD